MSDGQHIYFNWDVLDHRRILLAGPGAIAESGGLLLLSDVKKTKTVIFDEIHKYGKWRSFLKGFFDLYNNKCKIIVTGSARLNIFKQGGDSLMGRYFLYRMHPLSVAEIQDGSRGDSLIRQPTPLSRQKFNTLLQFGGFPEPYLTATMRFYNRWRRLRTEQLFREDLRDLSRVQDIGSVEILAENLIHQAGDLTNYSHLAANLNVSVDTIKRWISTLEALHFCFVVRPWFRNIPKSLRKQPKIYLWDWSLHSDQGKLYENFIACHLLKAVHWWTDIGLGDFRLYFIRDKEKREVDFLVCRDGLPWFLVEVKSGGKSKLSRSLKYFQQKIDAAHAFQVAMDLSHVQADCFAENDPVIVPATTFLSQLV
ncbi:MAG: ATP-binding protein [Deltaproteobacteria bacterium]|nr:ATP-binding protein [Deltaproteobacteria bacterium]